MARNESDPRAYTRMPSYGVYLVVVLLLTLAFFVLLIGAGVAVVRDRQDNMRVQLTVRAVYVTNTAVEAARQATATAKALATATPTNTATLPPTPIPQPTDTIAPSPTTVPPTATVETLPVTPSG
jgi:thiazole synthase ThiGH ThiG subunit